MGLRATKPSPANATATNAGASASASPASTATSGSGKSGLLALPIGHILFNEGDKASSLYIIQKGQLRLFRPKGRGFIELTVLRAGEVIGEMAYFAEDPNDQKRSCSAQAITPTEVIEISFNAFTKTLSTLNPWFKTIFNTLAERLRKTNTRLKELESNSVSSVHGPGGNQSEYKFFRNIDVVRLLSTFFLVIKAHSENKNNVFEIHKKTLKHYAIDIYNITDAKFEEFINLLKYLELLELAPDNDNIPNIMKFPRVDILRSLFIFINTQRNLADDKRIIISDKCEIFLQKILTQLYDKKIDTPWAEAEISSIITEFKTKGISVDASDLKPAIDSKFLTEPIVGNDGKLTCKVDHEFLKKNFLPIRFMNALSKFNEKKSKV
ncbi:MAG: cyclic nucleotide-binding domain-containing protein [Oligoflexia bacterium]|nr:cyclic nucleotide-binding domain-containing protein [Oligoflexia bacterium]